MPILTMIPLLSEVKHFLYFYFYLISTFLQFSFACLSTGILVFFVSNCMTSKSHMEKLAKLSLGRYIKMDQEPE